MFTWDMFQKAFVDRGELCHLEVQFRHEEMALCFGSAPKNQACDLSPLFLSHTLWALTYVMCYITNSG